MKRTRIWIGPILIVPSILLWALWIKSFNAGSSPVDRISIFLSHFPAGTTTQEIAAIEVVTSLAAIVAGSIAVRGSTTGGRVVSVLTIMVAALLSLLNLFQLL